MNDSKLMKVYDIRPTISGFARIAPSLPDGKGGDSRKAAIINSSLKTKEIKILEGIISRIYWVGQGGTWPMFELTAEDGETSQWPIEGDEGFFQIGRRARIHYYVYTFTDDEVAKHVSEGWNADFLREERTKVVEIHVQWP